MTHNQNGISVLVPQTLIPWKPAMALQCQPFSQAKPDPAVSICLSRLLHLEHVSINFLLLAHMNRVSGIIFSLENEWLLSVGRDKYLQWHDCTNGKRLGGYQTEAWCTSLQYPFK